MKLVVSVRSPFVADEAFIYQRLTRNKNKQHSNIRGLALALELDWTGLDWIRLDEVGYRLVQSSGILCFTIILLIPNPFFLVFVFFHVSSPL